MVEADREAAPWEAESPVLAGRGPSTDLQPSLRTVGTPPGSGPFWAGRFTVSSLEVPHDFA